MKITLVFLIFVFSLSAHTFSFQLGTGGITPHFVREKRNYCNQWNNTGIIVNKSYYVRMMFGSVGLTYMQGNDSICSEIEGLFLHHVFTYAEFYEIGVTLGGYAFNQENWDEHLEDTPEDIRAPEPVWTEFEGREVVPVLALDIGVHLIKRETWSLKLNNLITPVITNHSLALEFRF